MLKKLQIPRMNKHSRALVDLFETRSLGSPQNAVGFVLWRVVHRFQREIDDALAPLLLTHLQFTTLILVAWLRRAGQPVNQSEVARFGDIHPMQVSQILKVLESKGMVTRNGGGSDARSKQVDITSAGIKALHRALPLAIEVQERLFGAPGREGGFLLDALLQIDNERNP